MPAFSRNVSSDSIVAPWAPDTMIDPASSRARVVCGRQRACHDVRVLAVLTVISTVAGVIGAFAAVRQLRHVAAATGPRVTTVSTPDGGELDEPDDTSHAGAEENLVIVFMVAAVPAGIIIAVMFFAWLLTKMTGVDGGSGWAAVIYALPLLAGVIGALLVIGAYAASYALPSFDFLDPEWAVLHRHPDILARARGIAIGVLPVYLGTVVVGLAVGGFI